MPACHLTRRSHPWPHRPASTHLQCHARRSYEQLEQYALSASSRSRRGSYRSRPPFHVLLGEFAGRARLDEDVYVLASATLDNMQRVAKALAHVEPWLDLCDLHTLITSPASADDPAALQVRGACVAARSRVCMCNAARSPCRIWCRCAAPFACAQHKRLLPLTG